MRFHIIVVFVFVVLSLNSSATHIVGGDLHYEYLGDDTYTIILKVYRDCGTSSTDFDDPACIGVFNNGVLVQNVQIDMDDAVITDMDAIVNDPCLIPPSDLCVKEAVFIKTVEIPYLPGGFTLSYQRCCRNTTLVNCESNDDIGITLTTQIPDKAIYGDNSSPIFTNFPPIAICINEPFVFDHSAVDIDGDSLVYQFCNPLLSNETGFYICPPGAPDYPELVYYPEYSFEYPLDADPAFDVNSSTGLLTGTPIQLGQYVVGVCVLEYRDGNLLSTTNRDFQFNITTCSQNTIALVPEEEPCSGLTFDFENNSINAESYFWDFGDLEIDSDTSTVFEPNYTYADSGTYVVTMIANPGFDCADTSITTVYAYAPFSVDFELEDDICENGIRALDFIGLGNFSPNAEYSWSFGSGGDPEFSTEFDPSIVSYSSAGSYTVTFTVIDNQCEISVSEEFTIDPVPLAGIQEQTEFCGGLTVDFTSLSQFADTYSWDFGDAGNADISDEENPEYTYSDYGTYTVVLIVDEGSDCEDSDEVVVQILPPDPINMQYLVGVPQPCDTNLFVSILWTGSGADELVWDMGDGSILEENQNQYLYDDFGAYTITITASQELCDYVEQEEYDIYYDLSVIDLPILAPNVFTPNNDRSNDLYRLFYQGEDVLNPYPPSRNIFDYISDYSMRIYDRWGVLMYDTTVDEKNTWDGLYKQNEVTEGTYYYIITYKRKCLDQKVTTLSGHFEILRN